MTDSVRFADPLRGFGAAPRRGRDCQTFSQHGIVALRLEPLHGSRGDRGFNDLAQAGPMLDLLGERTIQNPCSGACSHRQRRAQTDRNPVCHPSNVAICYIESRAVTRHRSNGIPRGSAQDFFFLPFFFDFVSALLVEAGFAALLLLLLLLLWCFFVFLDEETPEPEVLLFPLGLEMKNST